MDNRTLGSTGISMSPIGLGTVKFGRSTSVKYPQSFTIPNDEQIVQLLNLARDLGINYIDTAPAYGNSEERIGQLRTGDRTDWVISSKAGESYDGQSSTFDYSAKAIRASVLQSVAHLQTDYLDVVYLHSDGIDESSDKFGESLIALQDLKQQGVVRATGISPKTIAGANLGIEMCDVIMIELNPHEQSMLPAVSDAVSQSIGVVIKKGFASGHFQHFSDNPIAESTPLDPIEKALHFLFVEQSGITSLVAGTINPTHLRSNVESLQRMLSLL